MSSKSLPTRSRKRVEIPGVINELIYKLKQKRSGLIGNLTKLINRITSYLSEANNNVHVISTFKDIEKTFYSIEQITEQYKNYVDSEESERASQLLFEQSAKFQHIKELFLNYVKTESKTSTKSTSKKTFSKASSNLSSKSSRTSSKSYRSVKSSLKLLHEHKQAQLEAQQLEAKTARKLDILEKKKQLEAQELLETMQDAKDRAEIAKLNASIFEEIEQTSPLPSETGTYKLQNINTLKGAAAFENKTTYHKTLNEYVASLQTLPSLPFETTPIADHITPGNDDTKVKSEAILKKANPFIDFKVKSPDDYPKNLINDTSLNLETQEPIDKFIDDLIEGQETKLNEYEFFSTTKILRLECESRSLPAIELMRFDGMSSKWPEFIENFKSRVHCKVSFDDNTRMERLLSVLDGEAKKSIQSIGSNGIFYASALKSLKRDFGNPVVVSHLKLKAVLDMPQIPTNDRILLRRYHQRLSSTTTWLKSMGYHSSLSSTENLAKAVARLPNFLRNKFYIYSKDKIFNEGGITLIDFQNWLDLRLKEIFNPIACLIAENEAKVKLNVKTKTHETKIRTFSTNKDFSLNSDNSKLTTINTYSRNFKCWICDNDHKVNDCKNFIEKPVDVRRKIVAEKGLCFNCLSKNHQIKECNSKKRCQELNCNGRHHTLLHLTPEQRKNFFNETPKTTVNCVASNDVFLQVIPVKLFNGENTITTNAILDSGSDTTLIRSDIAKQLSLEGKGTSLQISNVLAKSAVIESKIVNFEIASSSKSHRRVKIENAWTVQELNIPLRKRNINNLKERYEYLRNIDLPTINNSDVTVLIGVDVPFLHVQEDSKIGKKGEPIAVKTPLGWVLFGANKGKCNEICSNFLTNSNSNEQLNHIVEKFWEFDSYPTLPELHPKNLTKEENRALNILQSTTNKVEGHFEVGLLWKKDNVILPNNRPLAVKRMLNMEKRFNTDANFSNLYKKQINEYIQLGYAKELTKTECHQTSNVTNYIPHHGVFNQNKPNKIRVVFDAAAKFKNNSLNDNLLVGPDLLNNLCTILSRFRIGKYAVMADIEKMFHQVKVPIKDQDALRFVWRENKDQEIKDYVMRVHLFGKTDSPCCANWSLRSSANESSQEIADTIKRKFYMDDYLDSKHSKIETINTAKTLTDVLSKSGFNLTKWLSNSQSILKHLQSSKTTGAVNLDLDKLPIERALGLLWNPNNDTFGFKTISKNFQDSKRGILSLLGSVFDPLGFVTPCVLEGKLIMQELWRLKIDWDSSLPPDLQVRWDSWKDEMRNLNEISIPRWYRTGVNDVISQELHIFSDASPLAYGAVSYVRVKREENVDVSFIIGKSRVAPSQEKTVPKLELQAAVLAVRMKEFIINNIDFSISKIYFWADSQIVLKNIINEDRKFPVYERNRINEIREKSKLEQWYYVKGCDNPADEATRHCSIAQTKDSKWLHGPAFLLNDTSPQNFMKNCKLENDKFNVNVNTNVKQTVVNDLTDTKTSVAVNKEDEIKVVNWDRYSCWYKLLRHVSWLIKLKSNWISWKRHRPRNENLTYLTVRDIQHAKLDLLRLSQREIFPTEYRNLQQNKSLPKRSKLLPLRPIFEDHLIRVGGRIGLSHLPFDSKHQIILSPNHHISKLLVTDTHEAHHHVGRNSTLALVREKYWITSGKSFVRNTIHHCSVCKKRRIRPAAPLMGSLPLERMAYLEPAFSRTAVDYFGPLTVKRSRQTRSNAGTSKRYGALFTCLTTRAVHLELAGDMSTDSFLLAFKRFTARRGFPKTMNSDNGSNFVGAEKELRECLNELDQNRIRKEFTKNEITWKFNPPLSPWMGGAFESLVKSTKRALKVIVKDRVFTEEALQTFLTEVECTVNSRPLTPISDDIDDFNALTPNHFLLGRSSSNFPEVNVATQEIDSKRRWRAVQAATNMFWKRWLKEYLPTLTRRQKWDVTVRNFKIGDLVILTDRNVIRSHWPTGRVTNVFPGKDNVIRSVEIQTPSGTYIRASATLALFEEAQ